MPASDAESLPLQELHKGTPEKQQSCSFCGKAENEEEKLIHGPDVAICGDCSKLFVEILVDDGVVIRAAQKGGQTEEITRCALCSQEESPENLVVTCKGAGLITLSLCNQCVEVLHELHIDRRKLKGLPAYTHSRDLEAFLKQLFGGHYAEIWEDIEENFELFELVELATGCINDRVRDRRTTTSSSLKARIKTWGVE